MEGLVRGDGIAQRQMNEHHRHDGSAGRPGLARLVHQRHGAVEPHQSGLRVAGLDVQPGGLRQVLARLLRAVLAYERVCRFLPKRRCSLGILNLVG